jgi:hypothetical protein
MYTYWLVVATLPVHRAGDVEPNRELLVVATLPVHRAGDVEEPENCLSWQHCRYIKREMLRSRTENCLSWQRCPAT